MTLEISARTPDPDPPVTRAVPSRADDTRRSARLLFAAELAAGRVTAADFAVPEVTEAVTGRAVPALPLRYVQRLAVKRAWWAFDADVLAPFVAARRAVLGAAAAAPPRFLVRVDEYPLAGAFDPSERERAGFERFHSILTEAGVPYLLAVNSRVARDYLDPDGTENRPLLDEEIATLHRLRTDGVEFAVHGFDHRTRDAHPRRHSELHGLSADALGALLDRAFATLAPLGIAPDAFVPPFNRFSAAQFSVLADRFRVVCGGPETIAKLGLHRTLLVREGTIYVPSYSPFYGRADQVAAACERAIAAAPGVWIPVVLHWSWDRERVADLERLARVLAGHAHRWAALAA